VANLAALPVTVTIQMQPYRPLGVYKAFVQMVVTLVPPDEL